MLQRVEFEASERVGQFSQFTFSFENKSWQNKL